MQLSLVRRAAWLVAPPLLLATAPALRAQQSASVFDAPQVVLDEFGRFERTLDFDGDGFTDAIGWWWQGYTKQWVTITGYRNDGAGKLSEAWVTDQLNIVAGQIPNETVAGELSGDNRTDFAIGIGDKVVVYRSNALTKPSTWFTHALLVTDPVRSVAIGDFTGDGAKDVLVATSELRVLKNRGYPLPFTVGAAYPVGLPTADLAVGEFTGDATDDVLLQQNGALRLIPMLDGLAQPETVYAHSIPDPAGTVAGDVDGDGDLDAVVFGMSGSYQILRRTGPASFRLGAVTSGGPATNLDDVDGDGDLDGTCCGGGGGPQPENLLASKFEISINDGNGAFAAAFGIDSLGAEHLAGVADLDHDGDPDLVAGRVIYYPSAPLSASPVPAGGPLSPEPRRIADIDSDGDPDLWTGFGSLLRNQGQGSFSASTSVLPAAPAGTSFVGPGFPGDFDGDGDADLVVAHRQGATHLGMRLLLNSGGGFLDGGAASAAGLDFNLDAQTPYAPERSLAADADGDGDLDLITNQLEGPWTYPDEYHSSSAIWWNTGLGQFAPGIYFPWDETIQAVGDLDGDGLPDLLTVTDPDWKPGMHFGTGSGGFGPKVNFPSSPYFVVEPSDPMQLVDLDNDGDLDVLSEFINADNLMAWANNGNASQWTPTYPAPIDSLDWIAPKPVIFATDVDQDGWTDIVFGPAEKASNSIVVVRKNPVGLTAANSWQAPIVQVALPSAVADVDGDGDADLLGAMAWPNLRYHGAQSGSRVQLGSGNAGSGGIAPTLGAKGPFRMGEQPELRISGAAGSTFGLLAVGTQSAQLAGFPTPLCTLWLAPADPTLVTIPIGIPGQPGVAGSGYRAIPVSVNAGLLGTPWFHQVFLFDAGDPFLITATNGLELSYGS